jgi:hypothetical protein
MKTIKAQIQKLQQIKDALKDRDMIKAIDEKIHILKNKQTVLK